MAKAWQKRQWAIAASNRGRRHMTHPPITRWATPASQNMPQARSQSPQPKRWVGTGTTRPSSSR
jgi:hypothetical protein